MALSLNPIISPLSNTKTEFRKKPLSFLGAPTMMAGPPSFVFFAIFKIAFSVECINSGLKTKSSIGYPETNISGANKISALFFFALS